MYLSNMYVRMSIETCVTQHGLKASFVEILESYPACYQHFMSRPTPDEPSQTHCFLLLLVRHLLLLAWHLLLLAK